MDMLLMILGFTSMAYLAYYAYELFNSRNLVRVSVTDRERLKHEARMIARRRDKGYHV